MAWEYGNADVDWMNMPIGNYGAQFGTALSGQQSVPAQTEPNMWGLNAEDWRNIQYLTGALGQAALKGTNMEWLGNMGGVTAQMAKNAQVSAKNKEYQQLLQNIINPHVKGIAITENGDGTRTIKFDSEVMSPTNQMITQAAPQVASQTAPQTGAQTPTNTPLTTAPTQNIGTELSRGPSFFAGAQQPWWLQLGQ